MIGPHDLGGRHGFGALDLEKSDEVFHARWEAAMFVITNGLFASGTARNVDQFRHAIERIDPVSYLSDTYYGRWLGGAETLLVEAGVITQAELTEKAVALGADPHARVAARPATPVEQPPVNEAQPTAARPGARPSRFALGDRVRTSKAAPRGHTRLPGYARGAVGEIIALHDDWVFPDTNAHGLGENPQPLYTVEFTGSELWGEDAEPGLTICIDLFEPYLEPSP